MLNPRVTSAGSIMPRYPWLISNDLDRSKMVDKIKLMKNSFDVPYTQAQIDSADTWADNQASLIVGQIYAEAADVKKAYEDKKAAEGADFTPLEKKEIVALIAYLQRLGTDIKTTEIKTASTKYQTLALILFLLLFLGITYYVFSRPKKYYDEEASAPLDDDNEDKNF